MSGEFATAFLAPQAVYLAGDDNTISNSTIQLSSGNGVGVRPANSVVNNVIHDVDLGGTYAAGITIAGQSSRIISNTIYNTGRDGIRILGFPEVAATNSGEDPRPVRGGRIAFNNIYDYGLLAQDLAAIDINGEADGSGTSIDHNWLHDDLCYFSAGFRGAGIYLDNGSDHFLIHHNVMWNNGDAAVWLNASEGTVKDSIGDSIANRVYNNTDAGGERRGIVINGAGASSAIKLTRSAPQSKTTSPSISIPPPSSTRVTHQRSITTSSSR